MTVLDPLRMATLSVIADRLIPAAHGMPSAGEVVGDARLAFVISARPDLAEPLDAALRPELGVDVAARLEKLERDEPGNLSVLQLVIVAGYYTDKGVREKVGYNGQEAIEVKSWLVPQYIDEGLIDAMLARGPVWRDPSTGKRAVAQEFPTTYAELFTESGGPQGGSDGRNSA